MTSCSWLDFSGDPCHDADAGIFKGNFTVVRFNELY